MDVRNTLHKIRALRHHKSELRPPLAPIVRGDELSLGKHIIVVHTHSKDAYGRMHTMRKK